MGKLQIANASSEAANLETVLGITSPALYTSKLKRIYLHEITVTPRGADFAADVQLYLNDNYTGEELVTNGAFAADTDWTKGSGWTISAGAAHKVTAATTAISQEITAPVAGEIYKLSYGLTETASGITPSFGGDSAPADAGTGTHTPVLLASSTEATLAFTADATAVVDLDNVSLIKIGSNVVANNVLHDSIRSGTTLQYKRTFETKQPWSNTGWGLYLTTGGASCILDVVVTYEIV
jgi:hypothetical protein